MLIVISHKTNEETTRKKILIFEESFEILNLKYKKKSQLQARIKYIDHRSE